MGLLDKVKSAAQDAAAAAKKGTAQVQEKVEHAQLRKRADEAAKQLGYLIVRERTQDRPAGEAGDGLVSEIVALEAQIAEGDPTAPSGTSPQMSSGPSPVQISTTPAAPPTSASEPASGDFKLE
jgi:hypothetical protein